MNKKLLLLAMALTAMATAQADSPNSTLLTDTSRVYDIDEVVVVNLPKESFQLRFQPLSSSSFSGQQIERLGTQDIRELSGFVPSFVMPQYGSRYTSSMYIRGIGSRVNSPAVGVYVNDIPILNKSALNFHTYDLNRVDVLHGPQGTLYGMNTEGGLVRLYYRDPFLYQGTDVKASIGTHFWRKAEIAHYQKINDNMAFSLAGFYDGQNGFFKNQFDGKHADLMNEVGAKGQFMYRKNAFSLSLLADYQYVKQNGFPYGLLLSKQQTQDADITSPYYNLKAGSTLDPNTNRQSNYRRNMLNTGLHMTYKGNNLEFNSITTWQLLKDYMMMDIDYQPKDFMYMEERQLSNTVAQEFTLRNITGKWRWTTGATASYQWLSTDAPVTFGADMNSYLSNQITQYAYMGMLNAMAARMIPTFTGMGMSQEAAQKAALAAAALAIEKAGGCNINMQLGTIPGYFRTPTLNVGVFHESSIYLTPRLIATLGLRYDYSNVAINYNTSAVMSLDENVMGQNVKAKVTSLLQHKERDHFNELLPKIGLSYMIDNSNSNVYATVSKGYRSGGFNIQMFSDILQTELQQSAQRARGDVNLEHNDEAYERIAKTIAYKPETSWNYELGAHLNLLGNSLKLDIATFYMQVRNQQLSVMAGNYGFGRMMVNAGKSHSTGMELTARGAFLDNHLDWSITYGFTSAEFDEYTDSVAGKKQDYKNQHVPYVPQHTLGASADYRFDVDKSQLLYTPEGFTLRSITLGANLIAQGQTWWNVENTQKQRFYATLGAHAYFDFGRLGVNVWARNLTDTKYNTFAVESGATGQKLTFAQMGNPFQAGIDISLHF